MGSIKRIILGALLVSVGVRALGEEKCLYFPSPHSSPTRQYSDGDQTQIPFGMDHEHIHINRQHEQHSINKGKGDFLLVSKEEKYAAPIVVASNEDPAVHLAIRNFAQDVKRVTGVKMEVWNDTLPEGWKETKGRGIVIVGQARNLVSAVGSTVGEKRDTMTRNEDGEEGDLVGVAEGLQGQWEAWNVGVFNGNLTIMGSDRRGVIYALYTLSEQLGVSPWHWFADVPPHSHPVVYFNSTSSCSHGEPSVKYRGLFINDEIPVLWNWARKQFNRPEGPPFGVEMYEKIFEFVLRMKGNYFWPAMWDSMFSADGTSFDPKSGFGILPDEPIPGPNQILANRMGIVMGTSHHEPMGRNKLEWDLKGSGSWDWTNREVLEKWWAFGAERIKGDLGGEGKMESLITVGMRGDGDMPLEGGSKELVQDITAAQRNILGKVFETDDMSSIPQMWCMYKEVQGYFANGLEIPDDVTPMFADDNYGNLMMTLPSGSNHSGGGGIYYHADYVGHPRNYRWQNTNNLAKMWEQLQIARAFNTTQIWILNVGSMKFLELPIEWFLNMAYDSERWPRNSLDEFLELRAERDFGKEHAKEIGNIMATHSFYVGRLKAENVNAQSFSLINYNEANKILKLWDDLLERAKAVSHKIKNEKVKTAFWELVYLPIQLQSNLNRMYVAAAKNNLYAIQGREAANREGEKAEEYFKMDGKLTRDFYEILDGKWEHMLDMTHIGYQDWTNPLRDTMPPLTSLLSQNPYKPGRDGTRPGQWSYVRYTVENSFGSWPGTIRANCPRGFFCSDPVAYPIDPYGVQTRWVEVSSGGPMTSAFEAKANVSWLKVTPSKWEVKEDGTGDVRCEISVDWDKFPKGQDGEGHLEKSGSVDFWASDGSNMTFTVPVYRPPSPSLSEDFKGFIQGDGYVVMEAAHHTDQSSVEEYQWEEIKWYGRTLSGMEVYPTTARNFTPGTGPSLSYDFYTHGKSTRPDGKVKITIQIGPSLNFILHTQLAFAISIDDETPEVFTPIPTKGIENTGDVGSVPFDWEQTVVEEIRNITMSVELKGDTLDKGGRHRLAVWGMSAGIVLERVLVDLGGLEQRGYSYLGPPESRRIGH